MAARWGLRHGAIWRNADAGHFEVAKYVSRSWPIPRIVKAIQKVAPITAATLEILSQPVAGLFGEYNEPGTDEPKPNLYQRYAESREIVVLPWVRFRCPDGTEMPTGIRAMLQAATDHYQSKVYVNSAYRDPSYNRRVGGARYSQHMRCLAVDFRVAGVATGTLRSWIVSNRSKWKIGGVGTYGTHVHADLRATIAGKIVEWGGRIKRKYATRYAKRHYKKVRLARA
jgi:Uncharacterized protein conserved in bacteria